MKNYYVCFGSPDSNFWLRFPSYDVKNKRTLQFMLDDAVTGIINQYAHDFRPALGWRPR